MAQVVVELTADESKLLRAFNKIQEGQKKVEGGLKKVKKGGDDAFGKNAIANMTAYIAGVVGVTAVLGVAKRTLTDVKAEGDK